MTDVLMLQTPDGGEINLQNGQTVMSEGLETSSFLSCFGGNKLDSGLDADNPKQWWGNLGETDPAVQYRSQLQHLLATLPLTPANLARFEDAATSDLAWLTVSVADSVAVQATMPALNTVQIDVAIVINGGTTKFTFRNPALVK
jgi:phage gp46-like protein